MIAATRRKWFALALLLGVQFMVVLDIAIVNVALPSIQTDLRFSEQNLQWVVSAYALFFGGFLLLGGRVADLLGRRRLFIAGIVVFTGASLLSGLAWSEGALIGARALQGLGAALITPAALSILTTTFPEGKERNAALGAWGGVGAFGAVAGDLLGAALVTGGLVTLVYAITQANNNGWSSLETIALLATALVVLAAFVVWERRAAE